MKIAIVLIVAMVMMMGQEAEGWRWFRRIRIRIAKALAVAKILGKREVGDADFQAKYKAAAEDGVFTDEEIKSVFGVDDKGLAEFTETYDMDGDGVVQVEEYKAVQDLSASMEEEEEKKTTLK